MAFSKRLKHLPLMLLSMILVVWAMSVCFRLGFETPSTTVAISAGDISVEHMPQPTAPWQVIWFCDWRPLERVPLGIFYCSRRQMAVGTLTELYLPLSIFATAALPFVVGVWRRWQFRLWMYFAFVGLIAAQCAYFTYAASFG